MGALRRTKQRENTKTKCELDTAWALRPRQAGAAAAEARKSQGIEVNVRCSMDSIVSVGGKRCRNEQCR